MQLKLLETWFPFLQRRTINFDLHRQNATFINVKGPQTHLP
jgi:hypothetical protein